MTLFLRQIYLVFQKDMFAELREARHFLSIVLFGVLLLLMFSFALSVDPDLMRKMAPGLFWLTVFFSSQIALDHSFREEMEDEQWEGLLLLGIDPKALYLGKMFSNLTFVMVLQLFLLPLMAILFDITLTASLLFVLLLGSLGVATLGTLYSGVTAMIRERQILLPILLFPMLVPVLLASVKVTELMLAHDLFGQQVAWIKLLIVFDALFLVGSLLFSETLLDGV